MTDPCPYEKIIIFERKLFILFSFLSMLVPLLSLVEAFRPETESFATWFQRSGSTMVVFALIAETRAYKIFDVFKPSGFVGDTYSDAKEKYHPQTKLFSVFAFVLIAIGTLIWGYGDLLAS